MDERYAEVERALAAYEGRNALPASLPGEAERRATELLALSPAQLARMPPAELGEAAFVLRQFALYVQMVANRERARVRWAEENIKRVISPLLSQQTGASAEERKSSAVRGNDAARRLDKIRVEAQLRLDRIGFLSDKIENMAGALLALQATKRGHRE